MSACRGCGDDQEPVLGICWDVQSDIILLTHWGRVTHICVSNLTIIVLDNGLSPGRRQAIIWTNAEILLIGPLGTNFSEIWIVIHTFSFKKMHLKMSSAKWRPFRLGLNVLNVLEQCGERHVVYFAWRAPPWSWTLRQMWRSTINHFLMVSREVFCILPVGLYSHRHIFPPVARQNNSTGRVIPYSCRAVCMCFMCGTYFSYWL